MVANRQEGVVVAVNGSIAKVKTSRHTHCDNCGVCPGDTAVVLDSENPLQAQIGQRVELEVRDANMLQAAFIVFILPLAATCGGAWIGGYVASQLDYNMLTMQIAGGITAFALAVSYIKFFDKSASAGKDKLPVIVRIL